jgi:hypothetical protein
MCSISDKRLLDRLLHRTHPIHLEHKETRKASSIAAQNLLAMSLYTGTWHSQVGKDMFISHILHDEVWA